MRRLRPNDVVVANGFNKFHLTVAAAVLDQAGYLQVLLTGAYPYRLMRAVVSLTGNRWPRLAKFCDRAEKIDESRIRADFVAEAFHFSQYLLRGWPALGILAGKIDMASYRFCSWNSLAMLRASAEGARIFHYRSGFGLAAAAAARERGMVLICDHSIAHPAVLDYLIANGGRLPTDPTVLRVPDFWRGVIEDIDGADLVLVNSHFVRDTFLAAGNTGDRIEVVYWGLDDNFLASIPSRAPGGDREVLRFLFAGAWEKRKGCEVVSAALDFVTGPSELHIAGPVGPDQEAGLSRLQEGRNVVRHGAMRRSDLARLMSECDVLVFPSLAEGSARVVFEAMACGCAIITTPNAGSVVQSGKHGWVVPPGDFRALAVAMNEACQARKFVAAAGVGNAALVRAQYGQRDYSNGLVGVYQRALDRHRSPAALG